MNAFEEAMAYVPLVPNMKQTTEVLREKDEDIKIPQHNILRYNFGFKKVTSKKSHKNLKRKKKKGK